MLLIDLLSLIAVSGWHCACIWFATANRSEFYGLYCAWRTGCISACNNRVSDVRDDFFMLVRKLDSIDKKLDDLLASQTAELRQPDGGLPKTEAGEPAHTE